MRNYEVVRHLGEGIHGIVKLVQDKDRHRHFVRKKLSLEIKEVNEYLENEVATMAKLRHPNITALVEAYVDYDGSVYIVMEYTDAGDLQRHICKRKVKEKHLSEDEIMSVFVQLALALDHMHSNQILHRDLKPSNVLLTSDGFVKLCDFGFAKELCSAVHVTTTVCGTPYYFSPEICHSLQYSCRSDIWSLGIILYELITLRKPFTARTMDALRNKIIMEDPDKMSGPPRSEELVSLCSSLLTKSYTERPFIHTVLGEPFVRRHIEHLVTALRKGMNSSVHFMERITAEYPPLNKTATLSPSSSPSTSTSPPTSPSSAPASTSFRVTTRNFSMTSAIPPKSQGVLDSTVVGCLPFTWKGESEDERGTSKMTTTPEMPEPRVLHERSVFDVRVMVSSQCPADVIFELAAAYDYYEACKRLKKLIDECILK